MSVRGCLAREQFVPRPRSEVFTFFEDAANLARITPPFLHFRILTPRPIAMHEGTLIDYELRLFRVPLRWRTRIESYVVGERFVDVQLRGPYRSWRHTHEFTDAADGTWMRDRVDYEIGFGPFGRIAHALFVRRTLEAIFDYRRKVVAEIFADRAPVTAEPATPRTAVA